VGPRDRPHLTPQRLPPPFAATPTASQSGVYPSEGRCVLSPDDGHGETPCGGRRPRRPVRRSSLPVLSLVGRSGPAQGQQQQQPWHYAVSCERSEVAAFEGPRADTLCGRRSKAHSAQPRYERVRMEARPRGQQGDPAVDPAPRRSESGWDKAQHRRAADDSCESAWVRDDPNAASPAVALGDRGCAAAIVHHRRPGCAVALLARPNGRLT
jgi:hypothetical protein